MNTTLLAFVILYLLGTMGIGIYAGTRIKNTADFAVAGRSLPLAMVITTTFATWFGAETVMGIPAKFVQGGLNAVVEDPFGASMCLVLVGAFFASRLYKMSLLTIGDFYRHRFGEGVEVFCSIAIILSYLGWVAAQITALGLVFSVLSGGAIEPWIGMVIGTTLVLIYVLIGGMLAVAWTDFIQMIVLVVGLSLIAVMASQQAGGADKVLDMAVANDWFKILPEHTPDGWIAFIAAAVTMMLGSIPQQDVFQRVMSAKDSDTARKGAIIGGFSYLAFAFVPMFIVASSLIIMPAETKALLANDPQKVLPTLILSKMPLIAQIFFFGALVSAIKSTSSATLLAPSTSFVENILKNIHPGMSDKQVLLSLRITIFIFTGLVLTYAIKMQGTAIYDMVSSAYQVTLVGAFVPLTFGLYWTRATTQGAILSIAGGIGVWGAFLANSAWGEAFPGQLAGLIAALIGMVLGSLVPQIIPDKRTRQAHMA
ncbi:MAG TPA: sodium:solute symporter family protein [Aquabacterium sp.]|uniref:sodium:solute symporter family protein n=1 Tax=Aquabacterium sp. TaxID=1872578 RepID=UPI002E32CC9E|nr:sodium:solute symporter family protein [Aquabacterium sp.]HEX5356929.1 sodium:solute symporter family protein [Aquabacterium sp.]